MGKDVVAMLFMHGKAHLQLMICPCLKIISLLRDW